MLSELRAFGATKHNQMLNQDDIFRAAERLLMEYGFVEARSAADEMVAAWRRSSAPDAKEGLRTWRNIRTAIDAMDAHADAA